MNDAATNRAILKKLRAWAEFGHRKKFSHMILSRNWSGTPLIPLYVKYGDSVLERLHDLEVIGEEAIEVYNMTLPIEDQLAESHSWHTETVEGTAPV